MFYQGDQSKMGELIAFPRTGTKVVWLSEGHKELQRGYYPSQVGTVRKRNALPWIHPGTGFARTVRYL